MSRQTTAYALIGALLFGGGLSSSTYQSEEVEIVQLIWRKTPVDRCRGFDEAGCLVRRSCTWFRPSQRKSGFLLPEDCAFASWK